MSTAGKLERSREGVGGRPMERPVWAASRSGDPVGGRPRRPGRVTEGPTARVRASTSPWTHLDTPLLSRATIAGVQGN
jgi:hypothetical protein